MIVKVLINTTVKQLNKVYDYNVPQELEKNIALGKRVEVNFGNGKNTSIDGIIVKIEYDLNKEDVPYKLKNIKSILDDVSYIDKSRLSLAKYMAYTYFCNVYDVLKLMLPPGTSSNTSSKNMSEKFDVVLKLAKPILEIEEDIQNEKITSAKHIELLKFLQDNENVYIDDVVSGLGISKAIIKTVEKNGYIVLQKIIQETSNLDIYNIPKDEKKLPSKEQQDAINCVLNYIKKEEYKKILLYGVTGSGKTEVYMQIIEEVILKGKKVIFLVPEISLTHQSVIRLVGRFGTKVAILHSKMKISERKSEYKKIKEGKVDIILGARSAIFAPVDNLGLIILDEEHDPSYYSGTKPKYSTKEVAEYICKQNNAVLLLGSATPEISDFYNAKKGDIELVTLKNRAGGATLPNIEIIDTKQERILGNKSIISQRLKQELLETKKSDNQSMVFLNRRGYESYFKCQNCSYIFKCPACDIALTYHKKNNLLHCHYCSHVEKNVSICPICGSDKIGISTIGTEKLEEEIKEISSDFKVLRMDADTTVARDSLNDILNKFKEKEADILLGTQMISKGHDFQNVTLVGILGVDNLLAISEYTSNERAYQNLSQVAGRAGRGDIAGKVILETSDVENYIIEAVKNNDYDLFYKKEIKYREIFEYPPFCDILLFELSSKNLDNLKSDATKLYNIFLNDLNNNEYFKLFSPKAPHIQKLNNKYRINILVKTKLNTEIYKYVYSKLSNYYKIQNKDVILVITKNPSSI